MIRVRTLLAAVILAGIAVPAVAADWPMRRGYRVARVAAPLPVISPFYLVNQGPEYSGPGIVIVKIGLTNTDLQRRYPYIGRMDGIPVRFTPGDYYGVTPDAIETGSISTGGRR